MIAVLFGIFALLVASSNAYIRANEGDDDEPGVLPVWKFEDRRASCCMSAGIQTKTKICAVLEVNPNELKVNAALAVNDRQVAQKSLSAGKLCYPYPPTPLSACLNMYWVDINPKAQTFDACFQATFTKLTSLDFHCIHYENGEFSQNESHKPSQKGLIDFGK